MAQDIRAFPALAKPLVLPPPASPAFSTRPLGPCASCGAPLSVAGSGVLRHQRTGTIACRPVLDELDGGWCEPDPVVPPAAVTLTPDLMVAAAAARARSEQDPAGIVTVRLHRQDAEVLYGVVGEQLPGRDAAGTNALLALGIQLRRQLGGAS